MTCIIVGKNGVIIGATRVIPKLQVSILCQCFSFRGNAKMNRETDV